MIRFLETNNAMIRLETFEFLVIIVLFHPSSHQIYLNISVLYLYMILNISIVHYFLYHKKFIF